MTTFENQITDYPKGARVEAIVPILCHDGAIPSGARGTITAHCNDGRAWVFFDGYDAGHTFHEPERCIRVVRTHRDDNCPANHEPSRHQHCDRPMRYDKISNGDVFNGQRLTGTYYCERCCTMQPTYETANDLPAAASERGKWEYVETRYGAEARAGQFNIRLHWTGLADIGDTRATIRQIVTEHNHHSTLVKQRERLLRLLRPVTSPTACYCAVMGSEKCWHCEARELITAIEQEREREKG